MQFIGDNVQDATEDQFALFDDIRSRLKMPHFALVGDHDVKEDPAAVGFRRRFGDPFGASALGGFRFLRLEHAGGPAAWNLSRIGGLVAVGDSLRPNPRASRSSSFNTTIPIRSGKTSRARGSTTGAVLVQKHPIEAILCRHTHYWQVANDGRNVHVAVRSIGDPEGGAPGYAVLYLQGDDLAVSYRCVEDRDALVLVTHPRQRLLATSGRHVVRDTDRVTVRVWSTDPISRVKYRVDDRAWCMLSSDDGVTWHGPLSAAALPKGRHSLEAWAEADNRRAGQQTIEFFVDPTGRYTAVPEVHPVVSSTAFC